MTTNFEIILDIRLIDYQSTTAAGINMDALRQSIDQQQSGLRKNNFSLCDLNTWIGRVEGIEEIQLGKWQSRNNALAALGLEQGGLLDKLEHLKKHYSPARIGLVIGSSTASIDRAEEAYRHLDENGHMDTEFQQPHVHNPHAPGLFVAHYTGVTGPTMTINTACSSSAKVFATGARWLEQGIVDAVLVGGVDTLCMSVLYGFHSLQLMSGHQCKPFDQNRDGINLGEAAGFTILMRAEDSANDTGISLRGYGESSDAHHMSHPHPEGLGARLAIQKALDMADLNSHQIDYINLHGTASHANDLIEGQLIGEMFPKSTQTSSTKAWMGHTLGAAGIVEAIIAADALLHNIVPGCLNLTSLDNELDFSIQSNNLKKQLTHVMSNSFGFGGSNCCVIFGKANKAG